MNNLITSEFAGGLMAELQSYLNLCEEIFALAARENQALNGHGEFQPLEFHERRKTLLPALEELLVKLRHRRIFWQQVSPAERARCAEATPLFQNIQSLLMKVLLLDRENQQAMLRRGLVPLKHLPTVAIQKPHFVASLYQRNSAT
ncbi:MAG TPA: hypothetical protein VIK59_03345 [Verrucomicrobiae bacterium]|nr:hypothetical protein [Verrucomicrobiae bacterium]